MKAPLPLLVLAALPLVAQVPEVTLDYTETRQHIDGFGSSTRQEDQLMRREADQIYYLETFGASIYRQFMSSFAMPLTTNVNQITPDRFDEEAFLDSAEIGIELKQRDPRLKLVGSVWSPPGWMKVSGSAVDGDQQPEANILREDREDHFAAYMVAWALKMRDDYNAPFYALSIQNEPQFNQFYPSCFYSYEQYARVLGKVGVALEEAGLGDIKLFGPEDMTDSWPRARSYLNQIVANEDANRALKIIASHGYLDGVEADNSTTSASNYYNRVVRVFNRPYWMTETSGDPHTWDGAMSVASRVHNSLVLGQASAFIYWLVNHESPFHGEELFEAGVPQKKAFAFQHFSKPVRPGAYRVELAGDVDQVDLSAFIHEDDETLVINAINRRSSSVSIDVTLPYDPGASLFQVYRTTDSLDYEQIDAETLIGGTLATTLPARSITSFVLDDATLPSLSLWHTTAREENVRNTPLGPIWDQFYPWVYIGGLEEWLYVLDASSARDSLFAYRLNTGEWIWMNTNWGPWYYAYTDGLWYGYSLEE